MKVTGYLCCVLGLVCVITAIDAIGLQDKIDQQFFDAMSVDDSAKTKRPFCNAFTGCGKKRSFDSENSVDNLEETTDRIRIPVPIYRALLRAATREIRETLDRQSSANNAVGDDDTAYPSYLTRKMPSYEQYHS